MVCHVVSVSLNRNLQLEIRPVNTDLRCVAVRGKTVARQQTNSGLACETATGRCDGRRQAAPPSYFAANQDSWYTVTHNYRSAGTLTAGVHS